ARAQVEFSASDGVAKTPFERSFAQERSRVVPERLREGIAKIGARDPDIGKHAAVEPGQKIGLAAGAARPRQILEPSGKQRDHGGERPQERAAGDWQNGVWGTHGSLQFSFSPVVTAPKSLLALPRTTRNPHPIPLEVQIYCTAGIDK